MSILSSLGASTDILLDALKDRSKASGKGDALVLKDNQLVEARVLKVLSETQAMLLIDGKKLTATTRMPLSENDTLQLKVTRSEGGQVLKIMEQPAAAPANEALTEMRRLGQEGPYGKISGLLNALPQADIAEAPAQTTPLATPVKGSPPLPAEHPESLGKPSPVPPDAGSGLEKIPVQARGPGQTFATDPGVPQSLKIALLITDLPDGALPELKNQLTDMARTLSGPTAQGSDAGNPGQSAAPAVIREKILTSLPPDQRQPALEFLDNPDLSWESKMNQVLSQGGMKTLKDFLALMSQGKVGPAEGGRTMPEAPTSLPETAGTETPGKQTAAPQPAPPDGPGIKTPDITPATRALAERLAEPPGFPGRTAPEENPAGTSQPPGGRLSSEAPWTPREPRPAGLFDGQPTVNPAQTKGTATGQEKPASSRMAAPAADTLGGAERQDAARTAETVRKSLDNLFNRLEADALKQGGLPDQESTRTLALVRKIRDLVDSFTLSPDRDYNGTTVRNLVRDSGLMWESKLRSLITGQAEKNMAITRETVDSLIEGDVKALSMKGTGQPETVRHNVAETLKTFSDSLEKMQLLNNQTADDSGKYLLPLPYVHDGNLRFGQLFIDLDRKKESREGDKERIIRVAFLLSMSRLGPVQAGVAIYKKSITGEFLVGSQEVKDLMDDALPGLASDLTAKGYTVRKMECRLTDPDTLSAASLVEKMAAPDAGGLNIRI